jgi:hypothetical protein
MCFLLSVPDLSDRSHGHGIIRYSLNVGGAGKMCQKHDCLHGFRSFVSLPSVEEGFFISLRTSEMIW